LLSRLTASKCEGKDLRITGGGVTITEETYFMAGEFQMCVECQ